MKTLVMKFGGASVHEIAQFSHIAEIIMAKREEFKRLIVVVSAMGETTDQLIQLAHSVNIDPPQREYDMLLSAGERISMSLLAMSLHAKGVNAVSYTGSQAGIMTCSQHAKARIIDVKPFRLNEILDKDQIAIVAGFQGVNPDSRDVTTLGRGGSDTTAVALGVALNAQYIEFYKDVYGIYDRDPKKTSDAIQYKHLSYQKALEIVEKGACVLHSRAIHLAAKNGMPLYVRSFQDRDKEGTWIKSEQQDHYPSKIYE